ncbi:hypothetical protein GGR28_000389 [Lewinella aquimaris]|uniref:MOSC domain-containing protein n=1 Tax=Neolewinella aquimaris TaxID=1835722 RepID=A0A840E6S1_9BACT|nr:MOSC N-terminal beta barrel domain-containing protein [Neolewinella aquimaris]MBB4077788.1 hypothetical protein [Neolewinella aquimaris]
MRVAAIYRYPVKSLGGESLNQADLAERGLVDDRRWMIVDASGQFISQRTHPHLARFGARVSGDRGLHIYRIADNRLLVDLPDARPKGPQTKRVTVWDDSLDAPVIDSPELANELGIPGIRLAYMHDGVERTIDPRYAKSGERVSFADGYPYLFTTTASLNMLSQRYGRELDVRRFRPSVVIESATAYAEDEWTGLCIGSHSFYLPKPCARCVMITNDPDTGEREPAVLTTLATHRKRGNKVIFGMNGIWSGGDGPLRVGDEVTVI